MCVLCTVVLDADSVINEKLVLNSASKKKKKNSNQGYLLFYCCCCYSLNNHLIVIDVCIYTNYMFYNNIMCV